MKIKLSRNQWEKIGSEAKWTKEAQGAMYWEEKGPIQDYIKQCVDGMIDLRGGISRQNAAGQLASYLKDYSEWIDQRVNII